MLLRNPKAFAVLLLLAGGGVLAYFGEQWYRLPQYSEADIQHSVELNLAIDLERAGPHLRPEGERLEELRRRVREEVEADIRQEREQVERWLGFGLILIVFGLSQLLLSLAFKK